MILRATRPPPTSSTPAPSEKSVARPVEGSTLAADALPEAEALADAEAFADAEALSAAAAAAAGMGAGSPYSSSPTPCACAAAAQPSVKISTKRTMRAPEVTETVLLTLLTSFRPKGLCHRSRSVAYPSRRCYTRHKRKTRSGWWEGFPTPTIVNCTKSRLRCSTLSVPKC